HARPEPARAEHIAILGAQWLSIKTDRIGAPLQLSGVVHDRIRKAHDVAADADVDRGAAKLIGSVRSRAREVGDPAAGKRTHRPLFDASLQLGPAWKAILARDGVQRVGKLG